tara:strand:- start:481 stop:672 length:192 start_codon:yes stop_codon:yes gene_type:complete
LLVVEVVVDKNQRLLTVVVEVVDPKAPPAGVLVLILKVVVEHKVLPVIMLPLFPEALQLVANF